MSLRERIAFLVQWGRDFEHTGAVQPSSRFLARAMTAPLRRLHAENPRQAARVLEIGPGTGAVTRAIASSMGPDDRLDCYEINGSFVRYLRAAIDTDATLSTIAGRVDVHHAPAQALPEGESFDVVVCSAPLNNFDAATIDAILRAAIGAIDDTGSVTLFEYLLLPSLRAATASGASKARLRCAQAAKQRWLSRCARGSSIVYRNLPPARVHELGTVKDARAAE